MSANKPSSPTFITPWIGSFFRSGIVNSLKIDYQRYSDTNFEKTKEFTDEFSNPTFMKDYSINETSGTLYLEVTDGNGLGGKTTKELKISPASC